MTVTAVPSLPEDVVTKLSIWRARTNEFEAYRRAYMKTVEEKEASEKEAALALLACDGIDLLPGQAYGYFYAMEDNERLAIVVTRMANGNYDITGMKSDESHHARTFLNKIT